MKCPYCGCEDSKVTDSRADEDNSIKRRRQCLGCLKRFNTYERVESISVMVIKKDGKREPFMKEKVEEGIIRSCHKRPVAYADITAIVEDIENAVFNMGEKEVSSDVIGSLVMEKLKDLDQVAYVRFASVYREFKDVNTFMEEIKKILN